MNLTAEMPPGYRLVTLGSVESTNTEAMRLAMTGDPGLVWLVANEQVKGRGRSGRGWTSVPGNLYASLLLRLACGPEIAQQLALVAGVAAIDAVRSIAQNSGQPPFSLDRASDPPSREKKVAVPNIAPRLKWPNDILIGEAKLGGILLESARDLGGPGLVTVIGIGLNVAGVPDGLGRAATSLADRGIATERGTLLCALAAAMDSALTIWNEGAGFPASRTAWLERAGPMGEELTVNAGTGPVAGRYDGIDGDGALLLVDSLGEKRRFTYGDVTLASPAREQ